jgi:phosphatidylglycerophosphatase A
MFASKEATVISQQSERTTLHRIVLLVGSIGPLGHMPASGTVAVAAAGIPLAWAMRAYLSPGVFWLIVAVFTGLSVWLHDAGDRMLGEKDSRKLVWDELAGFFVAVAIMPWTWQMVTMAFFLERAIDIAKIPPANWIEKRVPGGWGVVGDDLMAGLYTMLILLAVERWAPVWVWGG